MSRVPSKFGTSFDCFGTLVSVDVPDDPAALVADELEIRGVAVPRDWQNAYRTPQIDAPRHAEIPLTEHVRAVLGNSSFETPQPDSEVVRDAVLAAFESDVRTRDGATEAVRAMKRHGPVGVLSNCSVPGLVERSLERSALDRQSFDAIVTSVGCGWRKPDRRAFKAVTDRLDISLPSLVHVGDDVETDGGATAVGAHAVLIDDVSLEELPEFITEAGGNG